jgi:hypothetical protein
MSEPDKKSSAWPWIAVPAAAITLFFVLRECQHRLPPAEHAPAVTVPAAPETPAVDPAAPSTSESATAESAATAEAAPTPEPAPAPQ